MLPFKGSGKFVKEEAERLKKARGDGRHQGNKQCPLDTAGIRHIFTQRDGDSEHTVCTGTTGVPVLRRGSRQEVISN